MYSTGGIILLLLASACVCHRIDVFGKHNFGIYGGTPINITEVPFMALYRGLHSNWGCGAVTVHEQFLVTAGHCDLPFNKRITVGTDKAMEGGNDYEIEKVFRHPKWTQRRGPDYDIAVIKLKQKLSFNDRVNFIKMADSSMILNDKDMLQTIGFGQTEKQDSSNQLQSVMLPFVDLKQCQQMYKNFQQHPTERSICAGGEAGKGSCYGDSGSPIFYKGYLYGVTSWGKPCSLKDYPTVYASVVTMRDFIDGVIKSNSD